MQPSSLVFIPSKAEESQKLQLFGIPDLQCAWDFGGRVTHHRSGIAGGLSSD
jgi:hypothetical protein